MATIDSRGFVDDGTSGLRVAGSVSVGVTVAFATVTTDQAGVVAILSPGFYYVPASGSGTGGLFTGSVPAPGQWPGSSLTLSETVGGWAWMLTGSAFAANKPLFVMPPGTSASNGKTQGTNLSITKGGSVHMVSNGYFWLISAGSGSYTLTGAP